MMLAAEHLKQKQPLTITLDRRPPYTPAVAYKPAFGYQCSSWHSWAFKPGAAACYFGRAVQIYDCCCP